MTKTASLSQTSIYTKPSRKKVILRDLRMNYVVYLMVVPVILHFLVFSYRPMVGILMAFQDFSVARGLWGSRWVGFEHFETFFNSIFFFRLIRNTLLINIYRLLIFFPLPIIFAICLNEVRNQYFKRTVQTISYLPFFISSVVVISILREFVSSDGFITQVAVFFGDPGGALIARPEWFRTLFVGQHIWTQLGFASIIYISALSGIDQELYEAARIDGAGRLKQTWYITLPGLTPTIIILLILQIGQLMNVGFETILLMYSPAVFETADVISTYVFRVGILESNFSFSTAVGLFNSVINFILIATANTFSRRYGETSLW